MAFITQLETAFRQNANGETAIPMERYMRNLFPFFGIKNEKRKSILKEIWIKNALEIKQNYKKIALELFNKPEREFHYCALEIVIKESKNGYDFEDILWIEKLIITKSWWDSVDTVGKHILGKYFLCFPEQINPVISTYSKSDNLWLNRSAIIFQLGYKEKTDSELLFRECIKHSNSKEFFIQKAIGWALREFAKTNPELVKSFVLKTNLKPLSRREALKNL
jgi:3-methyladenine DNA glycosylase AlkD